MEAAFDVDRFKVGVWGPTLGGRVFPYSPKVRTQQEAELEALLRGVQLCIRVGWPVWRLIGDNSSALAQVAPLRASAGLQRQNRHLRRLFYLLQRLEGSLYLECVPGDLNPADSLSRIDSEWKGRMQDAFAGAADATWHCSRSRGSPPQSGSWVSLKGVGERPVIWMQWH